METKPTEMTTSTAVLEKLRQHHEDNEFMITKDGFTTKGKNYKPEDLTIIKTYRFEGASDPGDSSIIYLIQANDGTIGYTMDAYGAYSTHDEVNYDDLIKKLPVQEREEQEIFH